MARYYFSLEDGHPIGDPIGKYLPDENTALAAARRIAAKQKCPAQDRAFCRRGASYQQTACHL